MQNASRRDRQRRRRRVLLVPVALAVGTAVAALTPSTVHAGLGVDVDGDTVLDVNDNCPLVANTDQLDTDADQIGDVCDICNGGVGMTKPQLKLEGLLTAGGDDKLRSQGLLDFVTLPMPPLAIHDEGMRFELADLGANGNVLLDFTAPGGEAPNACGAKDGWKPNKTFTSATFTSATNAIPPGCVVGSALGIRQMQGQDKTAKGKGGSFKVKGEKGTYGPAVGPFRITVVLGGASEAAGGQCAHYSFAADECKAKLGKQFKCKGE